MKNYLILLMFLSSIIYGQKNMFNLSLNCFQGGDTISKEGLKGVKKLEIIPLEDFTNGQKYELLRWDLIIFYGDGVKANLTAKISGNPKLINTPLRFLIEGNTANYPKKIIIENIIVKLADERISTRPEKIVFHVGRTNKKCQKSSNLIAYKGKLLMGGKEKYPLANQKVVLKDNKNNEVQSTITDKYGDFNFQDINTQNSFKIEVVSVNQKIKDDQIFLANQDGTNLRSLKKVGDVFVYELLPVELSKLEDIEIDDTELTLTNFTNSSKTELTVVKDIYYDVNSSEINADSKIILDQIIGSMKQNKTLKLSIISHTDSKGDDNSNKILSEKRAKNVMNYFLSKGVEKERLISKGLGETKIINRCVNLIDCSEAEHKLNRRTEFIFTK